MHAADKGRDEIVKLLLDAGADLKAHKSGLTASILAKEAKQRCDVHFMPSANYGKIITMFRERQGR